MDTISNYKMAKKIYESYGIDTDEAIKKTRRNKTVTSVLARR